MRYGSHLIEMDDYLFPISESPFRGKIHANRRSKICSQALCVLQALLESTYVLPVLVCLSFLVLPSSARAWIANILFVLVDDQSPFDLKVYDPSSKLDSPVIDQLAKRGMVIDGALTWELGSGRFVRPLAI